MTTIPDSHNVQHKAIIRHPDEWEPHEDFPFDDVASRLDGVPPVDADSKAGIALRAVLSWAVNGTPSPTWECTVTRRVFRLASAYGLKRTP